MPDSTDRALRRLTSADPVPQGGREVVRYLGGREAAVRELTGMARSPRRGDYRTDAQYEEARRTWRSASRRVQRWTTEAGQRRAQASLSAPERRRAQAANRRAKRTEIRRRGVYMRVHGVFVIGSAGGREDRRERTMPRGGPGQLLQNGDEILDALLEGDLEEARALALGEFIAESGLPEWTELEEGRVRLWPVSSPEPTSW